LDVELQSSARFQVSAIAGTARMLTRIASAINILVDLFMLSLLSAPSLGPVACTVGALSKLLVHKLVMGIASKELFGRFATAL
jgi:hypothetical protein